MKELTELKNEFYEVMYKYEKSFSEEGVMANLTAWQTAKADLLSLLRRHPNWNEDEQAMQKFLHCRRIPVLRTHEQLHEIIHLYHLPQRFSGARPCDDRTWPQLHR